MSINVDWRREGDIQQLLSPRAPRRGQPLVLSCLPFRSVKMNGLGIPSMPSLSSEAGKIETRKV